MSTTTEPATSRAPETPPFRYDAAMAARIEARWQQRWAARRTFAAPNPAGPWADPDAVAALGDKLFVMDMFPYPSGAGLHVGHPLGYIATDVVARFERMRGRNVLHTLGYDAFGLPAEQYAVQTGAHPRATTEANTATMREQLRRLGLGHDERRSITTIDPAYYRWTQWIFTRLFEAWYDPQAPRGGGPDEAQLGRARPIAELVAELDAGTRALAPRPDGRTWGELEDGERAAAVDEHRLAYVSSAPVNWCPGLGTVLANEEVTADGRSERGNFPVVRRELRQWMMRITAYADRLVADLDRLDWPEPVKAMQRHWIGRSVGAVVDFPVAGAGTAGTAGDEAGPVQVFTTRPDTLFGATFLVLAPEHPLLADTTELPAAWAAPGGGQVPASWTGGAAGPREAVAAYRARAARATDAERGDDARAKTGVFTGLVATNPVDGRELPVFTADYVLMGYGTGAIMAVPGQDQRDWDFATAFDLPIIRTVEPPAGFVQDGGQAWTGAGTAINSANDTLDLGGMDVGDAKSAMLGWLGQRGAGRAQTTYRLRDWLFSRQRYWGEPFPVVWDEDGRPHAVPDEMLPVELPEVADYSPATFAPDDVDAEPVPPLARALDWVEVELDLGEGLRRYRRETNTMPNWAGSCWYHLRYLDPANEVALVDPEVEAYWTGPRGGGGAGSGGDDSAGAPDTGGVDLYVGGVEHAVLHLLYARFWHKALHDLGHVSSTEPFRRLVNQGYIQADAFTDARGAYVPAAEVVAGEDGTLTWDGEPVVREFGKIGKSLKNAVSPDEVYEAYGADTFRLYEMSMGPLEASRPWQTDAVAGPHRFLQRLWRTVVDEHTGNLLVTDAEPDGATARLLARTVAAVSADYENLRLNTALARLTELVNALTRSGGGAPRAVAEAMALMLAPLAPHVAEELWERLGHDQSLARAPFPVADPALLVQDSVTCVVQVAGKVRDRLEVAADVGEDELRERALASPAVARALAGAQVRTVVVRAPRLVNVVPAR